MADSIIEIDAEPRTAIQVKLVGTMYEVFPPKENFTMRLAATSEELKDNPLRLRELLDGWIDVAFGERADTIRDRLNDNADALDVTHVMKMIEKLVEVQTGNPTTSQSA